MPAYAGLDIRSEVYLGAWTAVPLTGPGSIRNSAPITITRGRQNMKSQLSPANATFTVDNRDGRWTLRNPNGAWYNAPGLTNGLVQNSPIRFSVPSSLAGIPAYLRMEADTTSGVTTPDTSTYATPTLVQSKTAAFNTATGTITLTSPTTAGNTLIVTYGGDGTVANPHLMSLTLGGLADHFAQVVSESVEENAQIWYDPSCAGGQTAVAFTTGSGSGTLSILVTVMEWSGLSPVAPSTDQTNTSSGAVTTPWQVASGATTLANELIIGTVFIFGTAAPTITGPGAPWTNIAGAASAGPVSQMTGWQAVTATGAYGYSGTATNLTGDFGACIATFQAKVIPGPLAVISGTLSVRADCKPTDWSQGYVLMAKWGATTVSQAWIFQLGTDGTISLAHSDGVSQFATSSGLPVPYFGQRIALRADYNISAQTVTFYTAPTMAGSWTQLGPVVATTATVLAPGPGQAVQVGGAAGGSPGMLGDVYEAQILATGVLKADPVFTSQTPGAASFADAQSNTWTLAGTAEISGRLYRFHGELAALPKAADPSQRNAYSQAQAGGITRRLQQQQTPASSPIYRAWVRKPSSLDLVAYWPGEDKSASSLIGPAIGRAAMSISGTPTLASSSVLACSAPLPVMAGATFTGQVVMPGLPLYQIMRFLLAVPSTGDTNGAIVASATFNGSLGSVGIGTLQLTYGTGGVLTLSAFTAAGSLIFSQSQTFGNAFLAACMVSMELYQNTNSYSLYVLPAGGTVAGFTNSTGFFLPQISGVAFGGGLSGSAMGHFAVMGAFEPVTAMAGPLNAWQAEAAGTRFARLCTEEGIACRITGPPARSAMMGKQTSKTISALLQECEDTDQGLMTEPRQVLGVGLVTNWAMCNQPPAAVLDFSQAQIDPKFSPASDDTLIVNDVTEGATDGSSARQTVASGPMSVLSPPAGVGRFDTSVSVNPASDAQLASLAGWYLHIRSADEDRYPAIPVQYARGTIPLGMLLADIGQYVQVKNTPSWVPPGPVRQLAIGVSESLGPQPLWPISMNAGPESPWETAICDDPVLGRCESDGSSLHANITAVATTMQADVPSGPLWTTTVAHFPFDIFMGGERITVTAISGASSPQTFTITRSVNGIVRAHTAGETIRLWNPAFLRL